MLGFKFIVVLLLINCMRGNGQTASEMSQICAVAYNNIMLADASSCSNYYQCINGVATLKSCSAGQSFSKDDQKCLPSTQVKCGTLSTADPCLGEKNTFVANPTNCNAYYYCSSTSVANEVFCPNGQYFDVDQCVYESQSSCINTPTTVTAADICFFMPNGVFFGVTTNCADYYICVNNVAYGNTCSPNVFNVNTQACDYASNYNCQQETNPGGTTVGEACTTKNEKTTVDVDGAPCNEYYTCNGTYYILTTCEGKLFYDPTAAKCVPETEAAVETCNRCVNHNSGFVATPPSTTLYLTCVNGKPYQDTPSSCPDSLYFDQTIQACTGKEPKYDCCNGGDDASGSGDGA